MGKIGGKDIPAKGYRIRMMGDLEGDSYGEGSVERGGRRGRKRKGRKRERLDDEAM